MQNKQLLKLYITGRRKRFLLIFFLIGAAVLFFSPVYIREAAVPSLLDWLLEVSGSVYLMHMIAVLSAACLFYGTAEWMRRSAGAIVTNRMVWPLILLGCTVSAFVMICLLFWSAAIGWFTFGGYGSENVHPFFELSSSPLWFVVSRLFIDWWSLCFLIFLGLAGALLAKKEQLALWLPLAWSTGLMLLFKFNISFKGLLPGEGMLLSIHAAGASPILAASVSEGAVLVLWLILYLATAKK
ncbi:hypothetical protein MOB77_02970 [Bacillus haynesii]|uniref:hypothetical protein n=1 Tax=Bacillus haynesii TaxID=1925021 RepID=UPI002280634A|nr:hypothetical protein [Bacillus haynesii]MCY8065942.1 hypothetical protein [Bacillus haynesii]MCY9223801.1 hypothetical protein [Bacillus haynesii]